MARPLVQSQDIKVGDVFKSFYVVPNYQREYVWESEHVEQLIKDIQAGINESDPDSAPEYFIGSIVVCPRDEKRLELIDGQQRLTTLFLTLCAIGERLKILHQTVPASLKAQIAASDVDTSGEDQHRYRLDLQYKDSADTLKRIAECGLSDNPEETLSIKNIQNAYDVARKLLAESFGNDAGALRGFYGYLINKVKLIQIQTDDVARALQVFETVNQRGVGLDSMDLLKNLLFMKAKTEDFDTIKDTWKELRDTIFDMKDRPLRFLRYFLLSHYRVDARGGKQGNLREDQIYGWLRDNEENCGYSSNPTEFVQELVCSAKTYKNFFNGLDKRGRKNIYLENMKILGGSTTRQHLILLLAGQHLTDDLFMRLAEEIEKAVFCLCNYSRKGSKIRARPCGVVYDFAGREE